MQRYKWIILTRLSAYKIKLIKTRLRLAQRLGKAILPALKKLQGPTRRRIIKAETKIDIFIIYRKAHACSRLI